MTTGEAAALLGVRSNTVASWIRTGRLRGERGRGSWVVARADVESIAAAARKVETSNE